MSTVADLWAVQVTDLSIEATHRRLLEIDEQVGETEELIAARELVAEQQATLDQWRQKQKTTETQVQDLSQKIRAAEQLLMSGKVRNPKELEGMQANVTSLRRRKTSLEGDIIEAMVETDNSRQALSLAQQELDAIESAWKTEQTALIAERKEFMAKAQGLTDRLRERWSGLSPEDRNLYRDLRARKGGRALAAVERSTCQGCGMGLPTRLVQQVRDGDRVFCPTCGRLLCSPT